MSPVLKTAGFLLLLSGLALPIRAQGGAEGVPLAQVERKYRQMSPVHIEKCDFNHDEVFTPTEMTCVQNIYRSMYLDRD